MPRGALVRLLLVVGLLAGCAALALTREPRLGLDLRGGTQITLQASDSPSGVVADAEATDRAIEVLRGRVDALGISEPTLTRAGEDRIIVELPDVQDPREAVETIGRTAQLTVHPVVRGGLASAEEEPSDEGNQILPSDQGDFIEVGPTSLEGDDITSAAAVQRQNSTDWTVAVDFSGDGSRAFGTLTAAAACAQGDAKRIAIVLDDEVISSPGVNTTPCGGSITGSTDITGNFTVDEAKDLSVLIEGGALPLPVEVIEQRTVGPTLGRAAIDASWKAGVIGLLTTGLFIALVYRFVGVLATIALTSYALLAYAMLVGLGSTLTLPGLAGFVLAIGLAIDANVLVFERAREEYAANPSAGLRRALMVGFNKAWTAIIDSNVTTLLAAALLFLLGSGPIKGFGVTLTIGVVASMVSALVIARVLTELGVSNRWVAGRPAFTGIGSVGRVRTWLERRDPDLMRRRGTWLGISAAALVLAVTGMVTQGLNLGVEFTGGRVLEYSTSSPLTADRAREVVADAGYPEATVQESDDDKISVRTGQISDDEAVAIETALGDAAGGATKQRDEKIGASLGSELRDKALIAFGIALLVQMIYLAIRFKWTFGVSAVLAMFHDVVIVTGIFAWLDKPIDGIFLAAALTIIGLSVNDTVVVFDRVRERWQASRPEESFTSLANKAAVETMPRTVNTGLGAMFILAALAVLGGDSLQDFAIALLLGLVIGTYSSVFTATPLVTYLQERWPMSRATKVRRQREPEDSGAVV
ncbi:protein translocase subunit SecD [uncultured Nocardioides sp.]|uniref:Multifunctional fusion protein n=1 Tax=uncultured Nocardioides sp. TaxID=198441 RepID=A0A6J4P6A0_9ACTN|nr:protein translocase subunit SecD [uncultured Nocardioides sp.]CAA9407340.1 MAG: Protein translocase subunit SecD / Protein translocase subunit SecF [uncultured Nocardioides sp.]